MLGKWKHFLNNGHYIGLLFMDLLKAFDVLYHLITRKVTFSLKFTSFT